MLATCVSIVIGASGLGLCSWFPYQAFGKAEIAVTRAPPSGSES
jgi:hypothetical protein